MTRFDSTESSDAGCSAAEALDLDALDQVFGGRLDSDSGIPRPIDWEEISRRPPSVGLG